MVLCIMKRNTHPADKKMVQRRTKLDTLMANEAGFPRS